VNNAFRVAISNRNVLGKNGASRILIEQAQKFSSKGARVYLYVSRINKALVSKDITIKHFFSLNPIKKKYDANNLHISLKISAIDLISICQLETVILCINKFFLCTI
jgi:hypothetical protein